MSIKLITFDELKPRKGVPYHRNHIRRMVAAGSFPKPVPLSSKRIAWVETEVDAWLAERASARDAQLTSDQFKHDGSVDPPDETGTSSERVAYTDIPLAGDSTP
jgi:prophage regulatory protein